MDGNPLKILQESEISPSGRRLYDKDVDTVALRAIEDVRNKGEAGLREWAENQGELRPGEPLLLARSELEQAYYRLPSGEQALLTRVTARVSAFAAAQRSCLANLDIAVPGGRAGHDFLPVARAGCYVPGGRYPLASSAIMTVTPAVAAGVGEVWCAGPRPLDSTLAAAWAAGASGFLCCGGAHGIAAMAFGVGVPRCDVIAGPGGKYVASAKRQLFGTVGMEAPAGPSELLVIADQSADPCTVAADLIAQAEHDTAAVPMLICFSENFARATQAALAEGLKTLPEPNSGIASTAMNNGWILVAKDRESAARAAERCAPEHLELHVDDPGYYAKAVSSAGAVFSGSAAAEVFGDYGAGPNHTLPTGGAARFAGGLSVLHFLRARTWLAMDAAGVLVKDSAAFARMEGLEGHAQAAEARALTR